MNDESIVLDALKYGSTASNLKMGASELRKVDNFWRGIDTDEIEDDFALEIICSDDLEKSGVVDLTDADHWYLEQISDEIIEEKYESGFVASMIKSFSKFISCLKLFSSKKSSIVSVYDKNHNDSKFMGDLFGKYNFLLSPRLVASLCFLIIAMGGAGIFMGDDDFEYQYIDSNQYAFLNEKSIKNDVVNELNFVNEDNNEAIKSADQLKHSVAISAGSLGSLPDISDSLMMSLSKAPSKRSQDWSALVMHSIENTPVDRKVVFKSRGEIIEKIEVGETTIIEKEDGSFHRSMLKENGEGLVVMKVVVSEKYNSFYASANQLGHNADKEISSYIVDLRPYLAAHSELDLSTLRPGDFLAAALHVSRDKVQPLMANIYYKGETSVLVGNQWYNNVKDEEEVCDEQYDCIPAARLLAEASVEFSSFN